ncbi:MAG: hypothetical protein AB1560_05355 [Pseudomonadota bacterium]
MNFLACKKKIIFFLILLLSGFNAQAEILLDSSFTGSSPSLNTPWTATDSIDPNLNYSGWDVISPALADIYNRAIPWPQSWQSSQGTGDNVFAFQLCNNTQVVNGQAVPSSLADAINHNQYIHFTIAPTSGPLNLNNKKIIFKIQRLNDGTTAAPREYSIFTSVGGFQVDYELSTVSIPANNYAVNEFSFIMPAAGYDNIMGAIEFRIYAYGTTYCWHPTSLTDFVIQDPLPLYSLSLTGTSGGSVTSTPNTQSMRFEEGTAVQLIATPDPGYHFTGWSGDVTGKGNPRTITMTSDKAVTANFAANVDSRMQIGMNLSMVNDWATSKAFVDVFKMTRPWVTKDTAWTYEWECWDSGKAGQIPLDVNGWPTYLPFVAGATNCVSGTVSNVQNANSTHYVHTILSEPLAAGDHKVLVTGTGKIKFRGAVNTIIFELTGGTTEIPLTIPPANNTNLQLLVYESQGSDPIRDIRIIRPGHASTYETQPFNPAYLDRLEPFGVLRFVHWGLTNGSPVATWENRTSKTTYTQARAEGVALEYMVELANTLQKDLWINIPHKADDNYVRQTARLLRDTVGANQKIYIEYSNETWNAGQSYPQTGYVRSQGVNLWPELTSTPWVAGDKYTALRSIRIWEIFQEEFGADPRVRRVLATQVGSASVTQNRIAAVNDPAINPSYLMPDVLAIAPYFGRTYTPNDIPPEAASYPTIDDVLNTAPASIIEQQSSVRNHKIMADTQGLELVCYEAGQHFVGIFGAQGDVNLTNILVAANRDNRMYQYYTDYLAMLDAEGVSNCAFFDDIEKPGNHGSWGALEYLEQPVSQAPKYRALIDFITEPADLSVVASVNPDTVYLNDAMTYTFIVVNNGPTTVAQVTFSDPLPAGISFVSVVPQQGSCAYAAGTVTCNLGSLASGANTSVTINATATAAGVIPNTATVSGSGSDTDPGNNSTTATITVNASADLSLSVVDAPDPALTGSPLSYTVTATNAGPSAATSVVVTHTLPGGVTGSGAPSQGSCTGTSVISCNLGTLNNGQSATVTVTATPGAEALFDPTPSSTFNVNVSASTMISAAETDLVPANNSATMSTNVRLACLGQVVTKRGTSGSDGTSSKRFAGGSNADVIHTLGGDDWIDGKGGNDTLCGGAGNDNINGSGGADTLSGGAGTDTCNGGSGTDSADGSCETVNSVP